MKKNAALKYRERDEKKSQPARWGADWSSERSSYRVIGKAKGRNPKGEIRSRNSRTQDIEGGNSGSRGAGHRTPSGDYSAEEMPDTGHCGQMSAEPKSGSNPDEMDGEGAAFAKRRQLPRRKSQMASRMNGRKGQNQRIPLPASFIMKSAAKVQKIIDICK